MLPPGSALSLVNSMALTATLGPFLGHADESSNHAVALEDRA